MAVVPSHANFSFAGVVIIEKAEMESKKQVTGQIQKIGQIGCIITNRPVLGVSRVPTAAYSILNHSADCLSQRRLAPRLVRTQCTAVLATGVVVLEAFEPSTEADLRLYSLISEAGRHTRNTDTQEVHSHKRPRRLLPARLHPQCRTPRRGARDGTAWLATVFLCLCAYACVCIGCPNGGGAVPSTLPLSLPGSPLSRTQA